MNLIYSLVLSAVLLLASEGEGFPKAKVMRDWFCPELLWLENAARFAA